MDSGYYHSCDWDLLGSCWDCLTQHPGNWWVVKEDSTTCCVPFPSELKFERTLDVNSTDRCPEVVLLKAATIRFGACGVAVCLGALGLLGKWIHRRFYGRGNQAEVVQSNEIEMVALGTTSGDGEAKEGPGEEGVGEVAEGPGEALAVSADSGNDYEGDNEDSSASDDPELSMLGYQSDDEFATEVVVMETAL